MLKIQNWLLATACLLAFTPVWALDADDLGDPKVVEAFVNGIVKPLMAEGHSPSGTFALMKDGQIIFAKGYGWQNVEQRIPVDPNTTLFRPGSISKLFTWISVMQLVEQGKLDLDADINTYLKTFQIKDSYPGQPVTLRHCMTHTPGFEDGALGYLIIEDAENVIPLADAMKKYQPDRVNPPGVKGAYSNYCTSLSGLVVANVSGLSFPAYVEKNIFDVLGMRNSSFEEPLPERLDKNMAVAYKYEAGKYVARPYELITNFIPAGSLAATATDMLKFGSALLNGGVYEGGRILQAQTLEEMNKTQFTYDDRVKGIGLGFLHYPWGDTDTFGHDGGTTAFFSHFGITPSAGLVIFSSFSGPGGAKTYATLSRAIYSEFFARSFHHDTPPTDFANRAAKFAGTYISWRGSFSKMEKLMGLASQVKVVPNGEGELMIGENRFVEIGDRLFRNVENGDVVAFQKNDQGEIIGYVKNGLSIMSMYKAGAHTSQAFNFGLLGLSVIVFLAVFLRYLYQRDRFRTLPAADKTAARAAVIAATSHLWVLIFGAIVAIAVGDQLMARIPLLFKFWLIFPIIATLATFYLLFQTALVWKNGLLSGRFVRIRYTIVSLCALFMAWFYYFWNILGFRYY
jgi:CubicO group peptidase (beta-lactamase class C family)